MDKGWREDQGNRSVNHRAVDCNLIWSGVGGERYVAGDSRAIGIGKSRVEREVLWPVDSLGPNFTCIPPEAAGSDGVVAGLMAPVSGSREIEAAQVGNCRETIRKLEVKSERIKPCKGLFLGRLRSATKFIKFLSVDFINMDCILIRKAVAKTAIGDLFGAAFV